MSLGEQFICCDDGNFYKCDFVRGDIWAISFEEFQSDELWIRSGPRPNGQPRNVARPLVSPHIVIGKHLLPIAGVTFVSHQNRGCPSKEYAVYAIKWSPDTAFPRSLISADQKPRDPSNVSEGTISCMTPAHHKRWSAAHSERAMA